MWIAGGLILLTVIIVASVVSAEPDGEKVYTEIVGRRDLQAVVTAPGEIDPKVKVNISAHVIGKIERLYFREGDRVRKGARLVDLEKHVFVAQRDRMKSEVANSRIEVNRARVSLSNADMQFGRAQKLLDQGIQARELYDNARLQMETARATLASAEEGVRRAQAGLTQAETDLRRTTIEAPIDGKVVQLSAHEGEVVVTGTMNNPGSVIAVIADLSEILVQAEVGETEITRIRIGQGAEVRVDAVADKKYEGRVVEIGSSAGTRAGSASSVRYFQVKVALHNADENLRPGMTAQVEVITESQKNTLAVPVQSVVERDPETLKRKGRKRGSQPESTSSKKKKKKYVMVVTGGKVTFTGVNSGISNTTHVAVLTGLKGGEQIVTGPFRTIRKLREGDAVRIEEEDREAAEKSSDEREQEK